MSHPNRTKPPAQRTSTDEPRRATRAELRQRIDRRDLRDALREAQTLCHFERVLVGA